MNLEMHSPKPLTQSDLQEFQSKRPTSVFLQFLLAFSTWGLAIFIGQNFANLAHSNFAVTSPIFFFICSSFLWITIWFLISNAQLRLAFLGHECIHNSLSDNRRLNAWLGTFACHHFLFSAYFRFRESHLWHHRSLATEYDPDLPSYQEYPLQRQDFIKKFLFRSLSLTYALRFLISFTEIPFLLNHLLFNHLRIPIQQASLLIANSETKRDRWIYLSWIALVLGLTTWFSLWTPLLLFWLIPLLFFTFPVIWLQNAFQHAPFAKNKKTPEFSRSIPTGSNPILRHLFPLHLNFHFEHHLAPAVPHHHLPKFSQKLKATEWASRLKNSTQSWQDAFDEFAPHELKHEEIKN